MSKTIKSLTILQVILFTCTLFVVNAQNSKFRVIDFVVSPNVDKQKYRWFESSIIELIEYEKNGNKLESVSKRTVLNENGNGVLYVNEIFSFTDNILSLHYLKTTMFNGDKLLYNPPIKYIVIPPNGKSYKWSFNRHDVKEGIEECESTLTKMTHENKTFDVLIIKRRKPYGEYPNSYTVEHYVKNYGLVRIEHHSYDGQVRVLKKRID